MATGVSASRLRTWERRYDIPRPARSATGRRQYSEDDLAIIRRMASLVAAGIPASEAADTVRIEGDSPPPATPPARQHPLLETLVHACLQYDDAGITRIVREVTTDGWDQGLDTVLFPALKEIGVRWSTGTVSCATEHFATEVIRRELAGSLLELPFVNQGAAAVLLACPEDERHEIGLLALGFLLRQRGLRVFYLGADVPGRELSYAATKTGADAICLSATTASGLASLGRTVRWLVSSGAFMRLFVGGPAFHKTGGDESMPGVRLPKSLSAAADAIANALGVGVE